MNNLQIEGQIELKNGEMNSINGGIGWFVAGLIVYIAGEILDGTLRYAGGERSR